MIAVVEYGKLNSGFGEKKQLDSLRVQPVLRVLRGNGQHKRRMDVIDAANLTQQAPSAEATQRA